MSTPAQVQTSATPILDRVTPLEQPHRTAKERFVGLGIGVLLGLGFSTTLFIAPGIFPPHIDSTELVAFLSLAFFLFNYPGIVIHELGHYIAGTLVGMRLNALRMGPLQINAPFRLSWHWNERRGIKGYASLLPTDNSIRKRQLFIFTVGGPLANVLSGCLVLLISPLAHVPALLEYAFLTNAFLLGVVNLIPFRAKGFDTDGRRLMMLAAGNAKAERWLALIQLQAILAGGSTDFENLPQALVQRAIAFKDASADTVGGHAIAYAGAYYRNDLEEAARLLEVCLAHAKFSPTVVVEALTCDAAIFQARCRRNLELAKAWRDDLPLKPVFPGLRLRAEAALLEAQGDLAGALQKLEDCRVLQSKVANDFQRRINLRSLERWIGELSPDASSAMTS